MGGRSFPININVRASSSAQLEARHIRRDAVASFATLTARIHRGLRSLALSVKALKVVWAEGALFRKYVRITGRILPFSRRCGVCCAVGLGRC